MPRKLTLDDRFWSKVDRSAGADACWPWLAHADGGYGRFMYEGRPHPAHRIAYQLAVGPIPLDLEIDHLCYVTRCVNPAHLEAVTRQENLRRSNARRAPTTAPVHEKWLAFLDLIEQPLPPFARLIIRV